MSLASKSPSALHHDARYEKTRMEVLLGGEKRLMISSTVLTDNQTNW